MFFCAASAGGQHAVRGGELPSQAVLQQSRERQPWGWTGPSKPNCPLIPEAPSPPRRADPGCQALHAHTVLPRVLSRLHGAASKPGRTIPLSHACCLPKRAPSAALPLLSFLFPLTKGFSSVLLKKKKKKRSHTSSCQSSAFHSGRDNASFFSSRSAASWRRAWERGTDFASPCLLEHNKVIVEKTRHQEADLERTTAPVESCASPVAAPTLAPLFAAGSRQAGSCGATADGDQMCVVAGYQDALCQISCLPNGRTPTSHHFARGLDGAKLLEAPGPAAWQSAEGRASTGEAPPRPVGSRNLGAGMSETTSCLHIHVLAAALPGLLGLLRAKPPGERAGGERGAVGAALGACGHGAVPNPC